MAPRRWKKHGLSDSAKSKIFVVILFTAAFLLFVAVTYYFGRQP